MKTHTKTLLTALTASIAVGSANAALLAEDTFSYDDGPLTGENGGTGWAGAYSTGGSVTGGVASFVEGQYRELSPIANESGDPLYFSAEMTKFGTDASYAVWLELSGNTAVNDDDVRIGFDNDLFSTAIEGDAGNSNIINSSGAITVETTYLLVAKIEFNVLGDDDQITMWIDPTGVETGTSLTATDTDTLSWTAPTYFVVYSNGIAADNVKVDNVRIGTTWASVVPEPGSLALLGLGGLCMLKRRRRHA